MTVEREMEMGKADGGNPGPAARDEAAMLAGLRAQGDTGPGQR